MSFDRDDILGARYGPTARPEEYGERLAGELSFHELFIGTRAQATQDGDNIRVGFTSPNLLSC